MGNIAENIAGSMDCGWLDRPVTTTMLRLVIEEMCAGAEGPRIGNAALDVAPRPDAESGAEAEAGMSVAFSSGQPGWPWVGDKGDRAAAVTWTFDSAVTIRRLSVRQADEQHWIRRYRLESSDDGANWRVVVPSRLVDSYHRQPFAFAKRLDILESSLLPPGAGAAWTTKYMQDYLYRSIEVLGPDSRYPDWLSPAYFSASAAYPFGFAGVYNAGDTANFNAVITAILCPDISLETQKVFVDLIDRFGYVPGAMGPGKDDKSITLDYSGTTWGPCGFFDIFAWNPNREFMGIFADACARWGRWWLANRDRDRDGWLEAGVHACKPSSRQFREQGAKENPELAKLCPEFWDYTGVHMEEVPAMLLSIYEQPWDDYPIFVRGRHRGLRFNPETCSVNIHFIETQLYIGMLLRFVDYAYRALGREAEAAWYRAESDRLYGLVAEHGWDEATGFYYDLDENGNLRSFVKHAGAFLPMLLGIPSPQQAARMVERLTDPGQFWTSYPVPTVSRDCPDYSPEHYWCGRAWPPVNYFILRGLLNYGCFAEADELLRRWVAHTGTCVAGAQTGFPPDIDMIVPENWNSETGEVIGSGGLGWGGMWLPAVIIRHFWPLTDNRFIIRPGGSFRLRWGTRGMC